MNKVNYHHEKQRYSIRKYAFGAASVLIGCAYMANAQVAHADQTTAAPVAESTTTSTLYSCPDSAINYRKYNLNTAASISCV